MNILIKKYQEGKTEGIKCGIFGKNTNDLVLIINNPSVRVENHPNLGVHYFLQFGIGFLNPETGESEIIQSIVDRLGNIKINESFYLTAVTATRRIAQEIENIYGLKKDKDYFLRGSLKWEYDKLPIRVTIPDRTLKEVPPEGSEIKYYGELTDHVKSLGVPIIEKGDLNIIYFPKILPEHEFIFNDERLLVEQI